MKRGGKMKKIKVCSLFSGVGGFEFGLYQACGKDKVEIVFSSEINTHARKVYEHFHGHMPHGDITEISENNIPDHDLLVAGFPCQAFSLSGKMLGFSDTRGTMFFEIARILKEKKPKMIVLENVKGLLTHQNGETFAVIANILSELNYTIDFSIVNSSTCGVAQNRERVFIAGIHNHPCEKWHMQTNNKVEKRIKEKLKKSSIKTFNFSFPSENIENPKIIDFLEKEVDESYFLDVEISSKLIRKIKEIGIGTQVFRMDDKRRGNVIHSWDIALKGEVSQEEKDCLERMILERRKGEKDGNPVSPMRVRGTKEMFQKLTRQKYLKQVTEDTYDFQFGNLSFEVSKIIPPNGQAPTITCTDAPKYSVLVKHNGEWCIRKITAKEAFLLQGFPYEELKNIHQLSLHERELYKMAGNSVTTYAVEKIVREMALFL